MGMAVLPGGHIGPPLRTHLQENRRGAPMCAPAQGWDRPFETVWFCWFQPCPLIRQPFGLPPSPQGEGLRSRTAPYKAFPLGGRWPGEAGSDEGAILRYLR